MSRILTAAECALVERALRSLAGDCIEVADASRLADELVAHWVDLIIDDEGHACTVVCPREGPRRHCETCFCDADPAADPVEVEIATTPEALVLP